MKTAVEISLYQLDPDFIPIIQDFIDRLNRCSGLVVTTNAMSTQVSGEHDVVFEALRRETAGTFAGQHRAVFVMKVLGGND